MGIFALRFPYIFYVLAAFIVFLGVSAIAVMRRERSRRRPDRSG
jgi:hypothetical protein